MKPITVAINKEPVLTIPFPNCFKTTVVTSTIPPKAKFSKLPKSFAPKPPAKFCIPTGISERPIDKIITPVTTDGKNDLIFFINVPKNASKIPPTNAAPRIPSYPYFNPIDIAIGTKAKLVPTTTGSLAPIGPKV